METTFHSDVNSINLQMMYINIIFRRLLRVKSYSPFFLLTLGIAVCSIKLFAHNMKLNILNWFWLKLMQYFVIIMHKANTIIYLVANLGSLYNNSENFLPLSELCNWFNWVKIFLENRPAEAAAIMMPSVSPCPSILVSGAKLESQSHPSPASHVAFKICERVITFSTSLLYTKVV